MHFFIILILFFSIIFHSLLSYAFCSICSHFIPLILVALLLSNFSFSNSVSSFTYFTNLLFYCYNNNYLQIIYYRFFILSLQVPPLILGKNPISVVSGFNFCFSITPSVPLPNVNVGLTTFLTTSAFMSFGTSFSFRN